MHDKKMETSKQDQVYLSRTTKTHDLEDMHDMHDKKMETSKRNQVFNSFFFTLKFL